MKKSTYRKINHSVPVQDLINYRSKIQNGIDTIFNIKENSSVLDINVKPETTYYKENVNYKAFNSIALITLINKSESEYIKPFFINNLINYINIVIDYYCKEDPDTIINFIKKDKNDLIKWLYNHCLDVYSTYIHLNSNCKNIIKEHSFYNLLYTKINDNIKEIYNYAILRLTNRYNKKLYKLIIKKIWNKNLDNRIMEYIDTLDIHYKKSLKYSIKNIFKQIIILSFNNVTPHPKNIGILIKQLKNKNKNYTTGLQPIFYKAFKILVKFIPHLNTSIFYKYIKKISINGIIYYTRCLIINIRSILTLFLIKNNLIKKGVNLLNTS